MDGNCMKPLFKSIAISNTVGNTAREIPHSSVAPYHNSGSRSFTNQHDLSLLSISPGGILVPRDSGRSSLLRILETLDSHKIPTMGFIYEELSNAKKEIQRNLKDKDWFKLPWILWHELFDIPLYEAAYYLNPFFHFSPNFNNDDSIKKGLQDCLTRMISDVEERSKIDRQIKEFEGANFFFAKSVAKNQKTPVEWWDSHGDGLPELQRLAIRILSLTCFSSGYEQDQSTLEIVLNRRSRSILQQKKKKKLNELIFAMQNLRLRNQQASRNALGKTTLDDLSPVDECLYSDDDPCVDDGLSILNSILDDTHSKEDNEGFSLNDLAFEDDTENLEVQVSNN
ncbi:hypothetical protein Cni_G18528 [Canna indica]|uniref:HAT C-terminal dimerisation domain-containing protein n=1 Tax=Canna indica TaxID=4628 RepID=A0AAQ3KJR5_9LILI|nr:hypothetical protein Cni_G18528 [Canna indica]